MCNGSSSRRSSSSSSSSSSSGRVSSSACCNVVILMTFFKVTGNIKLFNGKMPIFGTFCEGKLQARGYIDT